MIYYPVAIYHARLVKLADTKDLGSFAVRHAGSSPAPRTILSLFFRGDAAEPAAFRACVPDHGMTVCTSVM